MGSKMCIGNIKGRSRALFILDPWEAQFQPKRQLLAAITHVPGKGNWRKEVERSAIHRSRARNGAHERCRPGPHLLYSRIALHSIAPTVGPRDALPPECKPGPAGRQRACGPGFVCAPTITTFQHSNCPRVPPVLATLQCAAAQSTSLPQRNSSASGGRAISGGCKPALDLLA